MKFNVALSFTLSGIALFFISRAKEGKESLAKVVLPVLAFYVFFLILNLLITYFTGVNTGIESLFVKEGETRFLTTISLGVPSLPTMINFIMLGTSFILFSIGRSKKIIEGIGIAVLISGVIAVIGHIMNLEPLFYLVKGISSGMAIHTGTLFVTAGSAMVLLQRQTVQELRKDDSTKVKTKILFILLACSIVPIILVSIIVYETSKAAIFNEIIDKINTISDLKEKRINDYVDRHQILISTNVARPPLIDNLEKYMESNNDEPLSIVNGIIDAIKNSDTRIISVSLLSSSGVVVTSTNNTFIGNDLSNMVFFTTTIKGTQYFDVSLNKDKIPLAVLSGPLIKENQIMGIMLLYLDDSEFFSSINQGFGQTGEQIIAKLNAEGKIELLAPLKLDPTKIVFDYDPNIATGKAVSGNEGLYADIVDYRGVPVLASTRYIDKMGWGLTTKIDQAEILTKISTITNLAASLTVVTIIMVIFIALLLSYSITNPLMKLTEIANHVKKGSFTQRSKLRVSDEIGILANTFDLMLDEIEKNQKIITKQVADLKELDKRKEEFVSMVTHELKTPLSPIMGWCEALLDFNIMGSLNQAQIDAINTVYARAIKLRNLITDLLDAQKLDLKTIKFDYLSFQINDLLDDITNSLKPLTKTRHIQLINSTRENLQVKSDKNRIEQILTNLLYNAIEFVPEKTGIIEINIKSDNGNIVFMVKDNGVGISEEVQANLFQKFYQVDTSLRRKHGGVGLGLAVCKGLVEGLDGKIWVHSKQGEGTSFYFTIPKEHNENI